MFNDLSLRESAWLPLQLTRDSQKEIDLEKSSSDSTVARPAVGGAQEDVQCVALRDFDTRYTPAGLALASIRRSRIQSFSDALTQSSRQRAATLLLRSCEGSFRSPAATSKDWTPRASPRISVSARTPQLPQGSPIVNAQ